MNFKAGDRVHVTKLDWDDVDFYATLKERSLNTFLLTNCTDKEHENKFVWKIKRKISGNEDYYTLVVDEEDVNSKSYDSLIEEIERLKEENNNLKQSVSDYKEFAEDHLVSYLEHRAIEHENETLKSENKALRLQADNYYEMWQGELMNNEDYEDE